MWSELIAVMDRCCLLCVSFCSGVEQPHTVVTHSARDRTYIATVPI
jgi:hypothetical protein